ncbi:MULTISPECIES: carbonic anhydrase [Geobacter]|uniref:carbonic anhydrase n=1 Tax=Geobacter TaxID=28231 RepID=UPI002572B27F|nr:carbonic anhydrase [Geobacter sulfurreducens]BEH10573.1 carbonic anhydrase [Geobacter sulfurreducens subsp. ethanolicus]BET57817.1 carbonic anhydrase [Geobacter sp. 60473]HML79444.1 carbonic anhydrase [Geobacter sulfurreducens]
MKNRSSMVRGMFLGAGAVAISAVLAFGSGGVGVTADEALQQLMDGNKRYVAGQMKTCSASDTAKRESLAKGQKPYAIILSCSDSRVPPEIIFDKTMGEIFVVRVAGNIPDPVVLGSIEYAAEHIGSPLVMVLGHERCGAVTATVEAKGKAEGNIGSIVKTIAPAAAKALKEGKGKSKAEVVEAATDANLDLVAASLTRKSPVIRHLVKEGTLKIVKAKYDLDDGTVVLMDGKK